jgi:Ca2+-binding RTX toxin-like protein
MSARSILRKFNKKLADQTDNAATPATSAADAAAALAASSASGSEKLNKLVQKLQERNQRDERRSDDDRSNCNDNNGSGDDQDDGDDKGGTAAADTLLGRAGGDDLRGGAGDDTLVDSGGAAGGHGKDKFKGGDGNDQIHTHWGQDRVKGAAGDDVIYSRSDAGEPMIARLNGAENDLNAPDSPALTPGQPFDKKSTNDRLSGGAGADKFVFRIDINAVSSILAKHTNDAGEINWEAVTGENGNGGVPSHIHWVEAFGTDVIKDFSRAEGDKIIITGHTTDIADADAITHSDFNGDGKMDTIIKVISQQGANGTHDEDHLGRIVVLGDGTDDSQLSAADVGGIIQINANAHHGMFDALEDINPDWQIPDIADIPNQDLPNVLFGTRGSDTINGDDTANVLVDRGEWKDRANADTFNAGGGDDKIRTHWGKDTVDAGAGNDLIVSRSDAGEPAIAQATTDKKVYGNQPFDAAVTDDMLTGGTGSDTFFFRLDLNAKAAIIAKHIHDFSENHDHAGESDYSNIDWHGVTNENGNPHDHWLEGIGTDTITDFSHADDTIRIEGHTVAIASQTSEDLGGGKFKTTIKLKSEQGAAGAHDEDMLGTIIVLGDQVQADDIQLDAGVTHGAFGNIDEITFV